MKTRRKTNRLEAEADLPHDLTLQAEANLQLVAADDAKAGKRPTFSFTAYTGGALNVGFGLPVFVDLATTKARKNVAALLAHDPTQIVGQGKATITATGIEMTGTVTSDGSPAQTVIENARNGFKWGASIGASIGKLDFVSEGSFAKVNGKEIKGPAYIARNCVLGEVSFVAIGADEKASGRIAARHGHKESVMNFENWLKAQGIDNFDDLSASVQKTLKASFAAEGEDPPPADGNPPPAESGRKPKKPKPLRAAEGGEGGDGPGDNEPPADPVAQMTARHAAEAARIADIEAMFGTKQSALKAKAIAENWSKEKAGYELKLAELPKAPAGIIRDNQPASSQVLEAAIVMGARDDKKFLEAHYQAPVLEAAHKHRRIGLRALIQAHMALEGMACPSLSDPITDWVRAGFSTGTLSTLLGNSANKMMLQAFEAQPKRAPLVSKKLSANDFKTHTGVRTINSKGFEKVGAGGELKYGSLAESSFTYFVDTYGKIISITRQQWINDDLGAFQDLPPQIGRDAALKVEEVFWALVIANTGSYLATGNANYQEGAATALSIAGLTTAVQLLAEMEDGASRPIGVEGKYLVVPPALAFDAKQIYADSNLIASSLGATNAKVMSPTKNIYTGAFEPVVVPQLKAYTKKWYLFADPAQVAAFGLAYLNGQESPVVEDAALPSDCLGFAFRGYLDFGACQIDKQGAILSKGEA